MRPQAREVRNYLACMYRAIPKHFNQAQWHRVCVCIMLDCILLLYKRWFGGKLRRPAAHFFKFTNMMNVLIKVFEDDIAIFLTSMQYAFSKDNG
jgi:hypothetical protein